VNQLERVIMIDLYKVDVEIKSEIMVLMEDEKDINKLEKK
jgi:hypothetical protein